jgi:dihydrofolate synthase / folylpolyglutamate synthase
MYPNRFLTDFDKFGICLGLERINQLLLDLGDPQMNVPIIHVAGTNGKGSVCAFLSHILIKAGYRVGRYTSPHLIDWRERITVDNVWIGIEDFKIALSKVNEVILSDSMPTQFEVVTAAAWWYFSQQQVDIAVIETGLGGRLDATNVVERPLVSVITSIGMDHWQRLGNSLGAIAGEKAGIIKEKRPVVVGELPLEAREVIEEKARNCGSEITLVESAFPQNGGALWQDFEYQSGLLGKHQLINSAISIATIRVLRSQGWKVSDSDLKSGLANTRWPGRLQNLKYNSQDLWLDGAHNLEAAKALRDFFDQEFFGQSCSWVIGILETKDWKGMLKALLKPGDSLYAVSVPDHQSCDPQVLANFGGHLLEHKPQTYLNWQDGLIAAFIDRKGSSLTILCGSLYLVGACLQTYMREQHESSL